MQNLVKDSYLPPKKAKLSLLKTLVPVPPGSPKLGTSTLISGEELTALEIERIIELAEILQRGRRKRLGHQLLLGKTLVMMFDKPSLRTRLSFTIAMQELGGYVVESVSANRKSEEPEDFARVINGYAHALMIRTHKEADLERMRSHLRIPLINGLTDHYHPCQTLADLLTLRQCFGKLTDLRVTYIGDGNNILHSLLLMAPTVGIKVHYCCPPGYAPNADIIARAKQRAGAEAMIVAFTDPRAAVRGSHAVYTDVWTSMGFEAENQDRRAAFAKYQVNEELMRLAAHNACLLHCMPMVRGEEVSSTLPDSACSAIFAQAENRLHVQKALLALMLADPRSL